MGSRRCIALCADSVGKVPATQRILRGKAEVLDFIARNLQDYWGGQEWVAADINGGRGVILRRDGVATAAVSFAYDEAGAVTGIYIMRSPDKLPRLGAGDHVIFARRAGRT